MTEWYGNDRVQIKFNNSTKGNNIDVGDPLNYEVLIVVVGPRSKLREVGHTSNEFRLYRYTNEEVQHWKSKGGKHYCAKGRISKCLAKSSLHA